MEEYQLLYIVLRTREKLYISIKDIEKLTKLNLYGAIIGKAYYTGDIDLVEALKVAK